LPELIDLMVVYNLFSEKDLLKRIACDDETAFREVFNLYSRNILGFVSGFIHSEDEAGEIVQDTFLVLWNNRKALTEVEHPRNYIYTVARNKCYDYITRMARNEKELRLVWEDTQQGQADIEKNLFAKESGSVINGALLSLSDQKQNVFRMSRYEEMSHEEIAAATGLSKSKVKNIVVEVLKHLKVRLKQASVLFFLLACLDNFK